MNQWLMDNWMIFALILISLLILGLLRVLLWLSRSSVAHDSNFDPKNILNDQRTQHLALILSFGNPFFFSFWTNLVVPTAKRAMEAEEDLKTLQDKKEELAAEAKGLQEKIQAQEANLEAEPPNRPSKATPPSKPPKPWYHPILPIGLSLMLFLGIAEFLGIDIQRLDFSALLFLGLSGAICINLAEYWGIYVLVKTSPRDRVGEKQTKDAWWHRAVREPVVWLSAAIVVLETSFASPGLINLFPPRLAADPIFKLIVLAAAGLAALVNLIVAWGEAREQIQWELEKKAGEEKFKAEQENYWDSRQYQDDQEKRERRRIQKENLVPLKQQWGEVKARLSEIDKRIEAKNAQIKDFRRKAHYEYVRWERNVRLWMLFNRKKVDKIQKMYWETSSQVGTQNGHRAIREGQSYLKETPKFSEDSKNITDSD